MKKIIVFIAGLAVIAFVVAIALDPVEKQDADIDFIEIGYITDRDPSIVNGALYLVYEAPGEPALDAKISFDGSSICRAGGQEEPCVAINQTIMGAYGGKRVFVEGIRRESDILVRNLALDIEADRRFGFIRSVEKNGVNFLVTIDPVEFLSGDEAYRKAAEDTDCGEKDAAECVPSLNNDFYIRNISTSTETYNLLPDADIAIFENPGSPVLVPATSEAFADGFADPDSFMKAYTFRYLLNGSTIVSLQEQYVP
ncbi:MAG: hypothetical protein HZA81_01715 [Candidatus Taylorbacteria bacterium]|nr:hypothetical protein [Candidatus Taylorbacteria bacterium]